jgi:hypothetical protein
VQFSTEVKAEYFQCGQIFFAAYQKGPSGCLNLNFKLHTLFVFYDNTKEAQRAKKFSDMENVQN